MTNIIKACGVETFRVVQTYQINNPDYNYDPKTVIKQNMAFMRGVSKLAKEEREFPISMIISPEGKRTEGSLIKAENGIIMCGSLLSPALYFPVGIDFEGEGINKEELNLFKRVNLRVGETYLQQPGTPDKNLLKQLMTNLALTLPESRRGEYSQ